MLEQLHCKIRIERQEECHFALHRSTDAEKTRDYQSKKPAIFKFCDFAKGGTDTVEKMNDFYTNQGNTEWWAVLSLLFA